MDKVSATEYCRTVLSNSTSNGNRTTRIPKATCAIIYGLALFPLGFLVEGLLVYYWLGGQSALIFVLGILPLSYLTLHYFDRFNPPEKLAGIFRAISGIPSSQIQADALDRLVDQIRTLVDELREVLEASHPPANTERQPRTVNRALAIQMEISG